MAGPPMNLILCNSIRSQILPLSTANEAFLFSNAHCVQRSMKPDPHEPVFNESLKGNPWVILQPSDASKRCRSRYGTVLLPSNDPLQLIRYFQHMLAVTTMQLFARRTSILVPTAYCASLYKGTACFGMKS